MPRFTAGLLEFLSKEPAVEGWQQFALYNVPETSVTIGALKTSTENMGWNYSVEPFRPALTVSLPWRLGSLPGQH